MPRGVTITDTHTMPPKTASASEQAESSSKLVRPHPLGLFGAAPRPQIVGPQCRKLGWVEDTQTCRSSNSALAPSDKPAGGCSRCVGIGTRRASAALRGMAERGVSACCRVCRLYLRLSLNCRPDQCAI